MTTVKELVRKIKTDAAGNATGTLRCEGFVIDVEILDVRKVWNRTDYLVTPLQGTGEVWVSAERVSQDGIQKGGK